RHVRDPHESVIARRRQQSAVGRERHGAHHPIVFRFGPQEFARLGIPDPQHARPAPRGQEAAVRTERQADRHRTMSFQALKYLHVVGVGIAQEHAAAVTAGGQEPAVWANATPDAGHWWVPSLPGSTKTPGRFVKPQTLTVKSVPTEASRVPRGWNATLRTLRLWPRRAANSTPVPASNRPTVPSALAVANDRPSGLKAMPRTPPPWPWSVTGSLWQSPRR